MRNQFTYLFFIFLLALSGVSWGQVDDNWLDPKIINTLQARWPNSSAKARQKYRLIVADSTPPMSFERRTALKKGVLDILITGAELIKAQEEKDEAQRQRIVDELKPRADTSLASLEDKQVDFITEDGGLGDILGAIKGDIQFAEETVKRNPDDPAALTWAAQQYAKHEHPKKAQECLDQALKIDPNSAPALSGRAAIEYRFGSRSKASEYALAALRVNPQDARAFAVYKLSAGREPSKVDLSAVKGAFETKDSGGFNFQSKSLIGDPRYKDESKLPYVLQQKFGGVNAPPPISLNREKKDKPWGSGIPPLAPLAGIGAGLAAGLAFRKRADKKILIASSVAIATIFGWLAASTPVSLPPTSLHNKTLSRPGIIKKLRAPRTPTTTESSASRARTNAKWTCEATCNVQKINTAGICPPRTKGGASGASQELACREAKRAATQSTPPGCYSRHCQCDCSNN